MNKTWIPIFLWIMMSSFITYSPQNDLGWRSERKNPKGFRPYFYKKIATLRTGVDSEDFSLKFYANENLEGDPVASLNKNGVFYQGKKVCNLEIKKREVILSEKCPDYLPFGTRYRYTNAKQMAEKKLKFSNNISTYLIIEVDQKERVFQKSNDKKKLELIVIKIKGERLFGNHAELKTKGWSINFWNEFYESKIKTEKLLKDAKFKNFTSSIKKCVKNKNVECLAKYISKRVRFNGNRIAEHCIKEDIKKTGNRQERDPGKVAKCLLDAITRSPDYNDLEVAFSKDSFPCVMADDKNKAAGREYLFFLGNFNSIKVDINIADGSWKIVGFEAPSGHGGYGWCPKVKTENKRKNMIEPSETKIIPKPAPTPLLIFRPKKR